MTEAQDHALTAPETPAEAAGGDPPKAPEGPSLLEIAAERHRTLQDMLAPTKAQLSPDDVHDLRVAARRLTEVVGLFAPLMEDAMAEAAEGSLRGLRKAAGELRDLDVLEEHLERWRLPGAVRQVAAGIAAALPQRRKSLEAGLITARGTASVSGAMVFLARLFEEAGTAGRREASLEKLAAALAKRVKRRRKQLKAALGKAATKQTAVALHAARIAVKKLRYVLELGHEAALTRAGGELALLKRIQKLLGEHHDVHVITETLTTHLPPAGSVKNLSLSWGRYKRKTAREQAKRAAEFFARSYLWNSR